MRINLRTIGIVLSLSLFAALGISESRAQETAPQDARIPAGYKIIDGDIVVPVDFDEGRGTYDINFWPGGVVPYVLDPQVIANPAWQTQAEAAMALWEDAANVDFIPRDGHSNFLFIRNATFNASEGVGMAGGVHDIWINSFGWSNQFVIAHELGHALGYWHEQARLDRITACNGGACIQINSANICQNCCSDGAGNPIPCDPQFAFRGGGGGEYGPYDFGSVMHYGQCSFSCCNAATNPCQQGASCSSNLAACRTITVLPPNDVQWQGGIGQRNQLSDMDKLVMSFLYPEPDWRFVDGTWNGVDMGTFFEPYSTALLGLGATPTGGTLWIQPGDYVASGTWSYAMTVRAPLGDVTLGPG